MQEPKQRIHKPRPAPAEGFARISQLAALGCPYAPSTVWAKVRAGTFPAPLRLDGNVTVWRVSDIRQFLAELEQSASPAINRGAQLAELRKQKRSQAAA